MTIELPDYSFYFTDCDTPIGLTLSGDPSATLWTPRGYSFDSIEYSVDGVVDQMAFRLDNRDDALTVYFTGSVVQGSDVVLRQTVLDSSLDPLGSAIMFMGTIDGWEIDDEEVAITVASVMSRWSQRTLALHSPSCRWKKFKGAECGYAGSASWCDRTYKRCQALHNTDNFGGFRWLPSIVDKEIWWGRKRKV